MQWRVSSLVTHSLHATSNSTSTTSRRSGTGANYNAACCFVRASPGPCPGRASAGRDVPRATPANANYNANHSRTPPPSGYHE